MPVIIRVNSLEALSSSPVEVIIHAEPSNHDAELSRLATLLTSVRNNTKNFLRRSGADAGNAVFNALKSWLPWRDNRAREEDSDMNEVFLEGEAIRSKVELFNSSCGMQDAYQAPPFSLKGKAGLALGALSLSGAGLGATYYFSGHSNGQAGNLKRRAINAPDSVR